MTTPLITAAICTYNRCAYIGAAIESLAQQTLDRSQYEIIVVDNNSTDDTRQVVENMIARHPDVDIRYVVEPVQGLSAARNRAAKDGRGQYVAYLDDDAHTDPGWLTVILNAFQTIQPAPSCVGGRIYPDWEGGIPDWVPQHFLSLYSFLDHGDKLICLNDHPGRYYINGANMAFTKSLIMGDYAFSNDLGRKEGNLLSGEESQVIQNLMKDGYYAYYVPDSIVWHTVLPERQKKSYLIKRTIADGATQVILDKPSRQALPRRILYDGRMALYWSIKSGASLLLNRKKDAFHHFLLGAQKYGRTRMELKTFFNW